MKRSKIKYLLILTILLCLLTSCVANQTRMSVVTLDLKTNAPTSNIALLDIKEIEVVNGTTIDKPSYPVIDQRGISDWYTDLMLTDLWDFDSPINNDLVLYPKWSTVDRVEYHLDGGNNHPDNSDYYFPQNGSEINPASKDGHIFIGWYTDWLLTVPITHFPISGGEVELFAKFLAKNWNLARLDINLENNYPLENVNREDYIKAKVSLTETEDEFQLLDIDAEFRGRGNGSWGQDKKGYRIKFDSRVSIFGNEASRHWVIVPGQGDASMVRNGLAYTIVNETLDNIEYTTSTNFVEVYVNGEYRGLYLFAEHVRVDTGRVEIESEHGILDTGYLIEYDSYAYLEGEVGVYYFEVSGLKYPFTLKSPDPDDYSDEGISKELFMEQVKFIQDYMQQVVDAILSHNYSRLTELVDINSLVDMYLIHELFKNTDTGWSSFYFYKKPGGKLYSGPAWDFDLTAGLSTGDLSPEGLYVSDSITRIQPATANEMLIALMQNDNFVNAVKIRWNEVSDLIVDVINDRVNFVIQYGYQFQREASKWSNGVIWINDVNYVKDWLLSRIKWLNEHWKINNLTKNNTKFTIRK